MIYLFLPFTPLRVCEELLPEFVCEIIGYPPPVVLKIGNWPP